MQTLYHSTEDPGVPAPATTTPVLTPSLVCEVPLRVTPAQERILVARLEAARQVYNACLGEARTRVRLVRESKVFQRARTLPRADPARKTLFAQARQQHAFSNYALHAYVQALGQSWLGEHLDSLTLQKLASRAYGAANRLLVGKSHRVRFKGKHQLDTVEGKTNSSGIRWCQDHVEWKGLMLPARIDPRDPVLAHGLACPVKYVRLVRRKMGLRNRFYAQLVCEGTPYRKPQHIRGTGVVGLDLGPSTIAVVAQQAALREPFCPEVAPEAQALRRLERQLDRQRRANNPANYDDKGRVKHGKKRWHVSKRQRKVHTRRRDLHRRRAPPRKRSHGQLADRVLALGDTFQLERLSYRAWQRTYGRSVQVCAPGMFVERLSRLAVSAGGTIVAINPWRAKVSQTCHCRHVTAKRLSQRWPICPCGAEVQRRCCQRGPASAMLCRKLWGERRHRACCVACGASSTGTGAGTWPVSSPTPASRCSSRQPAYCSSCSRWRCASPAPRSRRAPRRRSYTTCRIASQPLPSPLSS